MTILAGLKIWATRAGPSYREIVTLSAQVGSARGTPGGNVSFATSSGLLGTAPLVNGTASLQTTLLAGAYTLTAACPGNASYAASSDSVPITVGRAIPTISLASSLNPSTVGQTITFTAQAAVLRGTPTGSVTFHADRLRWQL
jgi:hypothetical protein